MSNDEIDHVMESDEGYDHPESIVKAPKKKRTLSPEHLAKMREGRVRYLEAKRILKLSKTSVTQLNRYGANLELAKVARLSRAITLSTVLVCFMVVF